MTLAKFINENIDSILTEWEAFALTLRPPAETMTALALRNHAKEILLAIARDIDAAQTDAQQADKSKGWAPVLEGKETAAATHGALRHLAGFDLRQLAAEYRALRASVLKLWREHQSMQEDPLLTEMTRFNEAVDQALAESVARYSDEVARSRDTFLAILGHDLRSPLSAVSMSAHYLAIPGRVAAEGLPALVRIKQSVLTMNLMIRDLLEYTRTQPWQGHSGDAHGLRRRVHLRSRSRRGASGAPRLRLRSRMAGDLRGQVDPARLGQVLSNLLNNAIQYGTKGLPITLSARGETDTVVIEVMNQGPAIPADALQVIFNPLVQVRIEHPASFDPLSTSLGLGLFIAQEIVTGHGGTLGVESSDTKGTVFTIELPRTFKGRRIQSRRARVAK